MIKDLPRNGAGTGTLSRIRHDLLCVTFLDSGPQYDDSLSSERCAGMGHSRQSIVKLLTVPVALFALGAADVGRAADPSWDRFRITVGAFRPSINSNVRLDSSALLAGTPVDLEENLGLEDSSTLLSVEAIWRVTKRFSVEGSYFELGRSGSGTLTQPVDFGNQTFALNADVDTTLNTDIASLALQYSFWHGEKLDLAASVGAYLMRIEASMVSTTPANISESLSGDAPLPLLGLRAAYQFTSWMSLDLKARYFAANISDVDGSMTNLLAGLQFNPFEHLGIGLGYEHFEIDITSENQELPGKFLIEYSGPKLYMTAQF
jgi:hypothetical protein